MVSLDWLRNPDAYARTLYTLTMVVALSPDGDDKSVNNENDRPALLRCRRRADGALTHHDRQAAV